MKYSDPHVPDRFEIQEVLIDHEAEVQYRALDKTLQREVILKRPGPAMTALLRDSGDEERALRESRALARIAHPGVVRLLDVIPTEDGPLMVVEPLPGSTLGQHLTERGRLPANEVRKLGREIASALAAVHATGAVHRGLSEANVMIRPDGTACLAGFLFAKFPKSAVSLSSIIYRADETDDEGDAESNDDTKPSPVLPGHPAPEQIMGQVADARSDIFGLGCVLYRALTGEPAFRDILGAGWVPPADIRKLAPDVPKELAEVVLKCLARSPLARFQNAHELERALLDLTLGARRSPVVLAVSIASAMVALVVGGMLMNREAAPGSDRRGGIPTVAPSGTEGARRGAGPYDKRYAKSHALVIGIGDAYARHGFGRLPNAEGDAIAVADALEALDDGWDVTRLIGNDASRTNILREFEVLEKAGRDDRLLIYYAGHGEPHSKADDVGFLLPADAKSTSEDSSRSNWIPFDDVDRIFRQTVAKHILMLMDCCYAGRLGARRGGPTGFDEVFLTQRAQHIIASSQTRQRAEDGPQGGHSPFAEGVLNSLRMAKNGDGLPLYSSSLYTQIMKHMDDAGAENIPVLSYGPNSEGQFILVSDK